jgi:hypothetical protein
VISARNADASVSGRPDSTHIYQVHDRHPDDAHRRQQHRVHDQPDESAYDVSGPVAGKAAISHEDALQLGGVT